MKIFIAAALITIVVPLLIGRADLARADDAASAELVGASSAGIRILIRKIDDGPVLWDAPGKPATHASVPSGHHSVSVMCQVAKSGMSMMLPGQLSLEAEGGKTYDVSGEPLPNTLRCNVSAKPRP